MLTGALIVLVATSGAWSGETVPGRGERAPLFAGTTTLEVELETDLRALRHPRREPGFQPGVLRWHLDGESGEEVVGVMPRGRYRLDRENCQFPPLFLQFPEDASGPFAKQRVVPVTTHCQPSNRQYVVQEYLAYRTYAQLTEYSVSVRLARTRYVDASGRARPLETLSFFMEHFDALGARVGGTMIDSSELRPDESEPHATALVDLFQYMIGNTDWSILAQHNMALLRMTGGEVVPVPYDFDFAGVVNARYAAPDEKLKIRSVRQRLYRGFCRPEEIVHAALARIKSRRHAIYTLYRQTPELDPKLVGSSLRYYDRFFEVAQSPQALQDKILGACR